MDETEWERQISELWAATDSYESEEAFASAMTELIRRRPVDNPAPIFELASLDDFLGNEDRAIPLYEKALATGLDEVRNARARIQLASSLRNVGRPEDAVQVLRDSLASEEFDGAAQAFLALALFDAGKPAEALRTALSALAETLPAYGNPVKAYAAELIDEG